MHYLESLSLEKNPPAPTDSAIAVIRRMAHATTTAMTRAELETYEKDDIKKRYGCKVAGKVRRQKLISAAVGDGKMLLVQ